MCCCKVLWWLDGCPGEFCVKHCVVITTSAGTTRAPAPRAQVPYGSATVALPHCHSARHTCHSSTATLLQCTATLLQCTATLLQCTAALLQCTATLATVALPLRPREICPWPTGNITSPVIVVAPYAVYRKKNLLDALLQMS
jgi:hypothetical protein